MISFHANIHSFYNLTANMVEKYIFLFKFKFRCNNHQSRNPSSHHRFHHRGSCLDQSTCRSRIFPYRILPKNSHMIEKRLFIRLNQPRTPWRSIKGRRWSCNILMNHIWRRRRVKRRKAIISITVLCVDYCYLI